MTQDKTGQLLCTSCGVTVPNQVHFCISCEHILPLPDRVSYFEFMELPPKLDIDLKALEKTFYRLSRQFHPDFYQNRPDSEQRTALARVPPDLMMEILEIQELLEDFQSADEDEKAPLANQLKSGLEDMKERLEGTGGQLDVLCREYDRADEASKKAVLEKMRAIIDKSNYLRRIIENTESTLGTGS